MSSNNNLVYRRWDELLEEKFDIFRTIIQNSDKELLAAVVAHDRLNPVDWQASYAQAKGPSALADKRGVLMDLRDVLLKTNKLIREDTDEISNNFENLAKRGGNDEEWDRAIEDAEDLMRHKAFDQMTEMKKFAINRINSVDAKYRSTVGSIFGQACTALAGFQGSVHLFLAVAKETSGKWYRNPWDNLNIFQKSTKTWYDQAEQGIKRAFADDILGGPSTLENKDGVLKQLKPLLLQTNKDLREDTNRIVKNMRQLANKGGNKQEWYQVLDDAHELMKDTAEDQLTQMKRTAIPLIESVDQEHRQEVRDIFDKACNALAGFQGSVVLFINVAKQNPEMWSKFPDQNIETFQISVKNWYDLAAQTIDRGFQKNLLRGNRNGEESLSSIQEMATKLQGMGVDNIKIIPKGDGWALEIGAGM